MSIACDILTEITDTEVHKTLPETIKLLEDYLEVLERLNSIQDNAVLQFEIRGLQKHIITLREQAGEIFEEDEHEN